MESKNKRDKGLKMKVEKAKTKICPFTLCAEKYKDPIKPHIISYETRGSNCICGDCMAWEFTKTETFKTIKRKIGQEPEKVIEVNGIFYFLGEDGETYYSNMIELDNSQKEGYCKRITNERT